MHDAPCLFFACCFCCFWSHTNPQKVQKSPISSRNLDFPHPPQLHKRCRIFVPSTSRNRISGAILPAFRAAKT